MKSYAFLFWAYNVIWFGLATYLFTLLMRLGKVERRLDGVERAMRNDGAQESSGS